MGASSQRRGAQGEYAFIREAGGGMKVSRPRKKGIDVVTFRRLRFLARTWEVKRTKQGFKTLYTFVAQARAEGADALVLRQDGEPWLVVFELDTALEGMVWE